VAGCEVGIDAVAARVRSRRNGENGAMGSRIGTIVIDAADVEGLGAFWATVLGWTAHRDADGDLVLADPTGRAGFEMLVMRVPEPKAVKNRIHIDLNPSDSDQAEELARLLGLGAMKVDIGQGDQRWIVLADPEGNEFCLLADRVD
jgi:predicted enzyme related to lactoylglutathione lyase